MDTNDYVAIGILRSMILGTLMPKPHPSHAPLPSANIVNR